MNQNAAEQSGAGTPPARQAPENLGDPHHSRPGESDRRDACPPIPDHELLRRIGGGSYGDVWLAKNAVGTLRAVKIVYRRSFDRDEHFEREFRGLQKFEQLSRSHDGFVDILQLRRNEQVGYFYYVMELADDARHERSDGVLESWSNEQTAAAHHSITPTLQHARSYSPRTLRHDLKQHGRLPLPDCLQIGLGLADALAHLHAQGLVHRDIKPSNIIFVNGAPKLADIGLVTSIDDAHSLVGTVGYIPPEGPGAPQADIYSLGKVLYEAAFGKDRQEFPQLPADLQTHPDHTGLLELNEVITKACDGDPRRRYQSAVAMRADIALLQTGQSVKKKRTTERRLNIVKKLCAATALCTLIAAALLTLAHEIPRDTSNAAFRLSKYPSANKEYLEGVKCTLRYTKEGLAQGLSHFNRAIELDPNFTMAYHGLFEVYVGGKVLGLSGGEREFGMRTAGKKLIELDPMLAEAQAAQAYLDFLDWKWDTAEPRFRRAIQLNQKCAIAHMRYGFCLVMAGRPDEGQEELSTAEMIDPTIPKIKKNMGHVFYVKRQFREAILQYQKTLKMEPGFPEAHEGLGYANRALGNYLDAIDEFEKWELEPGKNRAGIQKHFNKLRQEYKDGGPRGYWMTCLEEAKATGDLYLQAQASAKLDNYAQALGLLEQAFAYPRLELSPVNLYWDECWDNVHTDPRFVEVLKKVGLKK